ncbi:MAG: hypothetical protein IJO42_00645 [Clostridia bacterium]|nr:hypothetical protein [Clostridia bacterium]
MSETDGIQRAIRALKTWEQDRQAVNGLQVQIDRLTADMIALTELGYVPSHPDAPRVTMKTLVDRKNALMVEQTALRDHLTHVERVMSALNEREREVLTVFYCKNLTSGVALRRLERQLNVEQAQVYNIRKRALRNFAKRMGYAHEGE